jgi:hypothetical protein
MPKFKDHSVGLYKYTYSPGKSVKTLCLEFDTLCSLFS